MGETHRLLWQSIGSRDSCPLRAITRLCGITLSEQRSRPGKPPAYAPVPDPKPGRFMAFLFDANTENYVPLAPHHTIGRLASIVDTHLDKPYISKLHATIEWRDQRWHLKNLGLNGTHLNGELLQQGDTRPLTLGDKIHLAELNDPAFSVIDLTPPADMLWPLEQNQVPQPIVLNRYNLLPDEQTPELALFIQDNQWHQEPLSQH